MGWVPGSMMLPLHPVGVVSYRWCCLLPTATHTHCFACCTSGAFPHAVIHVRFLTPTHNVCNTRATLTRETLSAQEALRRVGDGGGAECVLHAPVRRRRRPARPPRTRCRRPRSSTARSRMPATGSSPCPVRAAPRCERANPQPRTINAPSRPRPRRVGGACSAMGRQIRLPHALRLLNEAVWVAAGARHGEAHQGEEDRASGGLHARQYHLLGALFGCETRAGTSLSHVTAGRCGPQAARAALRLGTRPPIGPPLRHIRFPPRIPGAQGPAPAGRGCFKLCAGLAGARATPVR